MSKTTINTKETNLSFFDINNNCIKEDIWNELELGLWKNIKIDSYLYNNNLSAQVIDKSKPIFQNFHQIIEGTYWDNKTNRLKKKLYQPKTIENTSFNHFLTLCEEYFYNLGTDRIGVHVSGGLDSSLIIGILKFLKIPFVPIGLVSNSFEFRTERYIQHKLIECEADGILIDIEEYPLFSGLDHIVKHQIPDDDIKSIESSKALAKAFSERGCEVVLSGQGGDSLFVDRIDDLENIYFNIDYEFTNTKENDRIYNPLGIRLESFYSNLSIIDFFCNARAGYKEDVRKLWIREWAKSLLPRELSNYTYCADFFGLTLTGLNEAKKTIKNLLYEAYDLTSNKYFSEKNIRKFLDKDIFSFEYPQYIEYCGIISLASWLHSFNNDINA